MFGFSRSLTTSDLRTLETALARQLKIIENLQAEVRGLQGELHRIHDKERKAELAAMPRHRLVAKGKGGEIFLGEIYENTSAWDGSSKNQAERERHKALLDGFTSGKVLLAPGNIASIEIEEVK